MNERKNPRRNRAWPSVPDEEAIRRLLQEAGPRPALPNEDLAAIRENARAEWQRHYGDRAASRARTLWWLALAAGALVGAVGLAWWGKISNRPPAAAPVAGSIELVAGAVELKTGDETVGLSSGAVGRPVNAGSELETGTAEKPGRIALRMAGGASVRLDAGTRARLESASVVELQRGGVYVDAGPGPRDREDVAVRVPSGVFQAVGTQFEVRIEAAMTRLRVREGSVRLDRGETSVLTDAGGELIVHEDGKLIQRVAAAYGPDWDWVLQTAPMLDIEGLKVRSFLDWITREAGWRLELADEKTASLSDSVVLHGSIDHLTPDEATGVVLSSCGLRHRVSDDGTLVVFLAPKKGD